MDPAMYEMFSERPREAETTNINSDSAGFLKIALLITEPVHFELHAAVYAHHTKQASSLFRQIWAAPN